MFGKFSKIAGNLNVKSVIQTVEQTAKVDLGEKKEKKKKRRKVFFFFFSFSLSPWAVLIGDHNCTDLIFF
jgi:hypothetical protein